MTHAATGWLRSSVSMGSAPVPSSVYEPTVLAGLGDPTTQPASPCGCTDTGRTRRALAVGLVGALAGAVMVPEALRCEPLGRCSWVVGIVAISGLTTAWLYDTFSAPRAVA